MDKIKTLLIANRGEIAVRIIKTAKSLGVKTISVYSKADAGSTHVSAADEAVPLPGSNSTAYTDGDTIIEIAKQKGADAIIPGYGFLSENADFARSAKDAGIAWCGPVPEAIEAFGIKHVARGLAEKAGVPIVPGTKDLVDSAADAVEASEKIGYPVMLKATGGGGGMGLVTCNSAKEVTEGFKTVRSRGQSLFKNPGLFIEKYYPASHHVEVQVFGNGQGFAIHFGERECSIQRRHQKVVEECPSPFVEKHAGLRERLVTAAVDLAQSLNYGSAGTVEYLVDDESGDFFFLEMNTRLQVEHGITELCYDVDLVKLMLQQADAELAGKGGLDSEYLHSLQRESPKGAAIEVRVYAENPLRDYAPSPGLLQAVEWADVPNSRVDTWVRTGTTITPNYDPLIAKLMCHSSTRQETLKAMETMLVKSRICGPPTNLEFLATILESEKFKSGDTLTSFLGDFKFQPAAIDVISPGAYTLIQDLPARPSVGKGIPHSGPMDPMGFAIANMLVGNDRSVEGLEITLSGPELCFVQQAVVALTGAAMEAHLDGETFPMWTRVHVKAGQRLKIGKTTGAGCRAYLAVYGGFSNVATYFGSKSTSPLVGIGGYQGRQLAPGDLLTITENIPESLSQTAALPDHLTPKYSTEWEVMAMVGPHDEGYFLPSDIEMLYSTTWKISHNASRSAIRLVGPVPKFSRKDGGEGGAHPSNLVEYGYPIGGLNWTGDDPCIFPFDSPNFGGFVCSTTVIRAEWWKLGQLKAGDSMVYKRVSLNEALQLRQENDAFLNGLEKAIKSGADFEGIRPIDANFKSKGDYGTAVLWERAARDKEPQVRYRQGGDDHLIVEYGNEQFDLNHRCRVTALEKALHSPNSPSWLQAGLINTVGCCTSITLFYDGSKISREKLIAHLQSLEAELGDLSKTKVPCRRFKLPISFKSREQDEAIKRYMETQRPHAPYLPSNLDFVAKNNAFTPAQLKEIYLTGTFMAVVVGFYCGNTVSLPVDPRHRMSCPKQNPSRVFTPAGTVSWGGSCMSLYPVDSPGGYQMTGRTIPCFDLFGNKRAFSPQKPWLFADFDLLTYHEVSEAELDTQLEAFARGKYVWEFEEAVFDMEEHNRLLETTSDEVREIRQRQAVAQEEMSRAETESLRIWREEKAKSGVDESVVEKLLADPGITAIEAPVDANIWKLQVSDGDTVEPGSLVAVLEAMKLEINVRAPEDEQQGRKVEKVLVAAGDTVRAGAKIALLRKI